MRVLRKAGQLLAGSVVIAVIPTILAALFQEQATFRYLGDHYRFSFIYTICIASPCWAVMDRVGPRLWKTSRLVRLPSLIALLAALAFIGSLAANLVFTALGWQSLAIFWHELAFGLRIAIFLTVLLGVATTSVEVMRARLEAATEELRRRELEDERARQLITQARLSSLESRIHPHFFFNTLNSISALIREDPRKAERTVERLAALLRYSLDHSARGLVPLRQELHVVEDYLEIEKTRFGDRLRFAVEVPPDLGDLEVPPFALQTLVENSIKHAVAPNRHGGEIAVSARLVSASLWLEVSDDGPGFDRATIQHGHGLENLEDRLAALFDGAGRIELARRGGRMLVSVAIPQKKVLA
ncbi:MAG TPA: histidine kinase [Bryobacteraceae bacterium]|nr:histidine kinase [Bryobacteraceae bacterium]